MSIQQVFLRLKQLHEHESGFLILWLLIIISEREIYGLFM